MYPSSCTNAVKRIKGVCFGSQIKNSYLVLAQSLIIVVFFGWVEGRGLRDVCCLKRKLGTIERPLLVCLTVSDLSRSLCASRFNGTRRCISESGRGSNCPAKLSTGRTPRWNGSTKSFKGSGFRTDRPRTLEKSQCPATSSWV